jgi:hypothetical protein
VGRGTGVGEAGFGVGGSVAVEGRVVPGAGVAVWQDVMRRRNPVRKSFFMALLIT